MKKFYLSKTFWFSTLTFVGTWFVPAIKEFMASNPETFGTVWSLLALGLRAVTKDKLVLSDK